MERYLFYDDEERKELNGPSLIDGEYYSDQLTYRLSNQNQLRFINAENAYDISLGSVSSKRFNLDQRLKLNQKISDQLEFNLAYVERGSLEQSRSHLAVGLSYDLSELLTVSAYTSLFSSKSNNDIGFAGELHFSSKHSMTLFYTLTDFSFNERTEENIENIKSSKNFGFLGRYRPNNKEFLEYYVFKNTPLSRSFQDTGEIYNFEELRLGLRGVRALNTIFNLNYELESFNGNEALLGPVENTDISRKGLRVLTQMESFYWIFGLEYNFRRWVQFEDKVFHRNFMPHVWYKLRLNKILTSLDLGLETSFHSASGKTSLRSETDQNETIESRFNMRLNFELSKSAFLNLILSMDLDDASWEGGGGQFQMVF